MDSWLEGYRKAPRQAEPQLLRRLLGSRFRRAGADAGLPLLLSPGGNTQEIPHNAFMVHLTHQAKVEMLRRIKLLASCSKRELRFWRRKLTQSRRLRERF